jgi:lysozyme family protein
VSDFEPAVAVVLAHEGGFCDDANDPGGATNFGISRRFLSLHAMPDGANDIEHMTVDFAKDIYKRFFWTPSKYAEINDQTVATKIFDAAVDMGPQQANRLMQKAINDVFGESNSPLVPDGFVGSQTLQAVNKTDPGKLVYAMSQRFAAFYKALAAAKPTLSEFLPNWLHRAGWPN